MSVRNSMPKELGEGEEELEDPMLANIIIQHQKCKVKSFFVSTKRVEVNKDLI